MNQDHQVNPAPTDPPVQWAVPVYKVPLVPWARRALRVGRGNKAPRASQDGRETRDPRDSRDRVDHRVRLGYRVPKVNQDLPDRQASVDRAVRAARPESTAPVDPPARLVPLVLMELRVKEEKLAEMDLKDTLVCPDSQEWSVLPVAKETGACLEPWDPLARMERLGHEVLPAETVPPDHKDQQDPKAGAVPQESRVATDPPDLLDPLDPPDLPARAWLMTLLLSLLCYNKVQ